MFYQTHTLPNGIRLVHKPDDSPVAYCGMAINTGTRDEAENEQGMAHFIEHMLFKGTRKRRASHIINRLEDVGGELNAYTNKEETFVYSIVLKEDFERAMELTADIVFNSVFPENEIAKEVDVILDEIQSYNDSPSELIYDDFEELLFAHSPIGRNILGKADLLKNYTREDTSRFIANNYHTDEMVFFSLGKLDFKKLVHWAEKYLGGYPASLRPYKREEPQLYVPQTVTTHKDTHQIHLMLGNRAYPLNHPDRLGLYLLNNIIGGPGMNSLLNMALRERNGLAYNIESSYSGYTDTGVFSIYLGSDPKNKEKCVKLIHQELKKLREVKLSDAKLAKFKKQMMGQLAISSENKESMALNLGKSILHFNYMESSEEIQKRLADIDTAKIQAIANEVLDEKQMTSLLFF